MIGHRVMGVTLVHTGHFEESRAHLDRAIALFDPIEHRALALRFGSELWGYDFGLSVISLLVSWLP